MIADGPSANRPPHILLPVWALEPVLLFSRSLKAGVLGFALMAPVLLGGCDRQSESPAQPEAEAGGEGLSGTLQRNFKGEPLPDFTVAGADGEELALTSLKGQPVLINLWATWCAPCVIELPTLNALAEKPGSKLKVITISQDSGDHERVAAFLSDRGFAALPAWQDAKNDLTFHYGTGTLPTTVLYDAEGREVWRYVGGKEWDSAEATTLIAEAGE
ncbi:MAG: TlpA family protein disulfide reductase [Novosphingobium sp.]|nr:TlpA family protein disulfide reductase [Novosphingobium sp.]